MGVQISELRIRNYKCYESLDVILNESILLLGANNVGKTSLLEALELCFTQYKRINEEIVFIRKGELLKKDKQIILDVLITSEQEEFDEEWFDLFGEFVNQDPIKEKQYVAFRTTIKYNNLKGEYDLERKAMNVWPETEEVISFDNFSTRRVTREIIESLPVFYLDAKRDISSEMDEKFSYWGKLVKDIKMTPEDLVDFEEQLDHINDGIISNSDVLKHLSTSLNKITEVMNSGENSVEINPISRKIKDLNKGMEIRFTDKGAESFSIAHQGMGTRSWATFLTLSAYIDWKVKEMEEEERPFQPLLLLEEPEAHLHPQAQRKIYSQMKNLKGQKVISTHSPIIAAQARLEEIAHVYKKGETSNINHINIDALTSNDKRKLKEEVLKTRGDILFSDTLILCEGETEDQVLPYFFKEYFGQEPFELGTNILSVGGSGNYKPFMRIARDLDIDLFILSDGELSTIKEVTKHYKSIFNEVSGYEISQRIKFLPDGADFEEYLVNQGYSEELVRIIDSVENKEDSIGKFIHKNHGKMGKPKRTAEVCQECHQNIFERSIKDYQGEIGFKTALIDCLSNMKAEYSSQIGEVILEREGLDRIPLVIRDLFFELAKIKKYPVNERFATITEEGEYVKVDEETARNS